MNIPLQVLSRETVADRVLAFTLARPDGGELPSWQPGAHIDLTLPGELIRQYSLCSNPADADRWRIAVLHEPDGRGGSVVAHEQLMPGSSVIASLPRDNFGYRPTASDVLFIAGGIGITPILPMVHAAEAVGANWRLIYLGRSVEAMGFLAELEPYGDRVVVHPSVPLGRLALADAVASVTLANPEVYACGPERLLEVLAACCPAERLHVERFTGTGTAAEDTDTAFTVETGDGTEIEVAADETILAAMIRCGVPALNSCQEGICGTCETVVLGGTPLHRDQLLSDEERASNETMMICVSRCVGKRLVLEL